MKGYRQKRAGAGRDRLALRRPVHPSQTDRLLWTEWIEPEGELQRHQMSGR